jgi:predicted nucleotidyltransferase
VDPRSIAVAELRRRVPDLIAVYLFGSRARGDARPGSDVDVAVLAARPLGAGTRFAVQEELARLLGRDVDLVDLRAASAVMRVQVLEHGEVLYSDTSGRRAAFEMLALAGYARLNEERRAIIDDVRARGSVHGR